MLKIRVAIILIENGKILLVKHKKKNREYWVLPGGKLEAGERLENALVRELKEELNIRIKPERLIFLSEFQKTRKIYIIDLFFLGKIISGKLRLSQKDRVVKDAEFVEISELKKTTLLPPIAEFIQEAYEKNFKMSPLYLGRF